MDKAPSEIDPPVPRLTPPDAKDDDRAVKRDQMGRLCPACGQGVLAELSIHDDWEGRLTCDRCCQRVPRWHPCR